MYPATNSKNEVKQGHFTVFPTAPPRSDIQRGQSLSSLQDRSGV